MRIARLDGFEDMPVLIEPEGQGERALASLLDWTAAEKPKLDALLRTRGAVLFRGFEIKGPADFSRASSHLGGDLQNYVGGDSPRSEVAEKIYNSTEFPPHLPIGLHNELSYAGWWPSRVFFYCHVEPKVGGQTPIGNSRAIYGAMPSDLRERFEKKGVCYIQNLHKGVGPAKSWQQTFETDDPAVVEAYCRKHAMSFRWTDYGLNTSIRRDAVMTHPVTGEKAWFNQAEHWHGAIDSVRFWDAGTALTDEDRLPAHCTYGDGTPIGLDELETILEVSKTAERAFDWRERDLLMLDNLITAHGRRPFEGPRKILVAMV